MAPILTDSNSKDGIEEDVTIDRSALFPADWPEQVSLIFEEHFINNPPESNIDQISDCVKQVEKTKVRKLQSSSFYKVKVNGEKVLREWLVYSPQTGSVYCYDWKNINEALKSHESSSEHITCIGTLVTRRRVEGRIDTDIENVYLQEKEYWRALLQRVVATIKFLAKNGLAFYGSTTKIFAKGNGHFLSALEYLSEFDPFLANHLKRYGNPGSGHVNYISPSTCNEFIALLADAVKKFIVSELQTAKYFSIIVDSTPDISNVDQMSIIVRYVLPDGRPVERFLGFVQITSHTAENLAHVILGQLEDLGIDINYCRGQSYDNASNMSGRYNGLQAKIKTVTNSAHFVPCSSHSLNLVSNSAAECCLQAAIYFENVQSLYNFFSVSTYRWSILQKNLATSNNPKLTVVKRLCDTRWSARADAIKSIALGFDQIKMALQELDDDSKQKRCTAVEAIDLLKKMNTFEFAFMTIFWKKILDRTNATSKSLQEMTGSLTVACSLYDSLVKFVENLRNQSDDIESEAKQLQPNNQHYADFASRSRKRKKFADEGLGEEVLLTGRENFKINTFIPICDKLIRELKKRMESYSSVNDIFNIFFTDSSDKVFQTSLKNIEKFYAKDINIMELPDEIEQFKQLCKGNNVAKNPEDMLEFIINSNIVSTFCNIEILLRIYRSIPISNASGERSFSTLKRVKTYLRNCLNQDNTSSLAVLNVESDILNVIDK
ncbi:hypothetical protein PPYR_00174 [Photinus pyralis]|uniref:DUF4371 domain-containing protein n=1 Tax=Photinus pyralis TaxID=7054 RepID=A0A5N4B0T9_PHOPY|nr:hypothetical protein PPYR_00174 [Photinus pyralis]